jgi:hypothetical protein
LTRGSPRSITCSLVSNRPFSKNSLMLYMVRMDLVPAGTMMMGV